MAFTPYYQGNDETENPSILCSDDGQTWTVPDGLTNPVEAAPGLPKHNADPDIVVDANGTMWLYFMYREPGVVQKVYVRSSTDGVTWTAKQELLSDVDLSFASPAVLWDGTQWVMWYVDVTATPGVLKYRTCATPNGTWSAAQDCTITNTPTGKEPWHLNVIKYGTTYRCHMVFRAAGENHSYVIYAMTSTDGVTWTCTTTTSPLIGMGVDSWDNVFIYRAAALKIPGGCAIWYSAKNNTGAWHIGYTEESV